MNENEIKIEEDEDKIIYFNVNRTETKIYRFVIYKKATDRKFRLKIYEQYCDIELLKIVYKELERLGYIDKNKELLGEE